MSYIQWASQRPIGNVEGLALALIVRLVDTSCASPDGDEKFLSSGERMMAKLTPSTLNKEMVDRVAPSFAYMRRKIRLSPAIKTEYDEIKFFSGLSQEEADEWCEKNPGEVERVRKYLLKFVVGNGSLGFRCIG